MRQLIFADPHLAVEPLEALIPCSLKIQLGKPHPQQKNTGIVTQQPLRNRSGRPSVPSGQFCYCSRYQNVRCLETVSCSD